MKKVFVTACCGLLVYAAFTMGCMDRKPAPVCPVPTEINQTDFQASGFDGVDLLVVVDNSLSMAEEQDILATGFFTLINSLVNPLSDWPYPPVDDLRVAVVSSDMGLQWGTEGSLDGSPTDITGCTGRGDNGDLQTPTGGTINVDSNVIKCDVDGGQCPCENGGQNCTADWSCTGTNSTCTGSATVNCPTTLYGGEDWAENAAADNMDINREVACMSNLGTDGCGFEQQLEASVKGLSITPDFITQGHLLAVLVVSDEEDCSIADPGLFTSAEWDIDTNNGKMVNVACNWHDGAPDDQYLFATSRYLSEWTRLKGGSSSGVVFASIIGVPQKDSCEGAGNTLSGCLAESEMQYALRQEGTPPNEQNYFAYACQREEVTKATPGRRYVEVAQELGENGYVYSICNEDWSPAMADIASLIAEAVGQSCYTDSLVWVPMRKTEQEEQNCQGCGAAVCNMVYEYEYPCEADEELAACEDRLLAANQEQPICSLDRFEDVELTYEMVEGDSDQGTVHKMVVDCVVIKLPAPFDCGGADGADAKYQGENSPFGWYYCENQDCDDGTDPSGAECCKYGIKFTASAEEESAGRTVKVQCLQEFTFEDPNCQENTQEACNDDIDNDGNGVWDCDTDLSPPDGGTPHRADRNCCVVDANCEPVASNYGEEGLCPDKTGGDVLADHSGACLNQMSRCCLDYTGDLDAGSAGAAPQRCVWLKQQLESL